MKRQGKKPGSQKQQGTCSILRHHNHKHGQNCGHQALPHGDHVDYIHDGHRHRMHGTHVDECTVQTV